MFQNRPFGAGADRSAFHHLGISRRRVAHEAKGAPKARILAFSDTSQAELPRGMPSRQRPIRSQVCGTCNRQMEQLRLRREILPTHNRQGFNHLRLSNRPLTLSNAFVRIILLQSSIERMINPCASSQAVFVLTSRTETRDDLFLCLPHPCLASLRCSADNTGQCRDRSLLVEPFSVD